MTVKYSNANQHTTVLEVQKVNFDVDNGKIYESVELTLVNGSLIQIPIYTLDEILP